MSRRRAHARPDPTRPPPGLALVPGQVRYQLVTLARNPIATFTSVVVPVMLLVALDLVTPEMTLASLGRERVVQFLTPAMSTFAVLNVGFVDTILGTTLSREEGILKRLRGTPLPWWAYLAGRLGAVTVVAAGAVVLVVGVGVAFLHAHVAAAALPPLVETAAAGLAVSFAAGVALSGLVPSAEAALPIAYALLLPVAFISNVFFPAPAEARWLRTLAAALPAQPVASSMEAAFTGGARGLSGHELVVLGLWAAGSVLVAGLGFSWEPGSARLAARARSLALLPRTLRWHAWRRDVRP
jgi:ABC-2 type transport system permease protein